MTGYPRRCNRTITSCHDEDSAFAPWTNRKGEVKVAATTTCAPVVSVGALNPNQTVALFSNTGRWVRSYVNGAAVMSTTPPMQGGLQPMARIKAFGKVRESIDPDDFTGGFAVWSGTSFAAPVQAGRIAEKMVASMPLTGQKESASQAVDRAWKAVEKATDIKPH